MRPGPNGCTELLLTPLELLEALAKFVPPPRVHRHRYHGVLAPNARLRPHVVALPADRPRPISSPGSSIRHRPSNFLSVIRHRPDIRGRHDRVEPGHRLPQFGQDRLGWQIRADHRLDPRPVRLRVGQ